MTEMTDSGEEAGIINLLIKLRLEGDVDRQGQMGRKEAEMVRKEGNMRGGCREAVVKAERILYLKSCLH